MALGMENNEMSIGQPLADMAFNRIVPAISHELNTALTTVLGNAHILRSREASLDALSRGEALVSIETNAERLFKAIQNLLLFARMELGESLYLQPLVLPHLIENLILQESRRTSPRTIHLSSRAGAKPVSADESMIKIALRNLLDNASLYSPEEAAIEVVAIEQDGHIETLVLDEGPGIPEPELDLIFEPFYRSPSIMEVKPGIGLGLSVARRLAELHGGTLTAGNRETGGAAFSLTLPAISVDETRSP
jgi:K+-sensing histidine kinase KdpD